MDERQIKLIRGLKQVKSQKDAMLAQWEEEAKKGKLLLDEVEAIERELGHIEQSYCFAKARLEEQSLANAKLEQKLRHLQLEKNDKLSQHQLITERTSVAQKHSEQVKSAVLSVQKDLVEPELVALGERELQNAAQKIVKAINANEFDEVSFQIKSAYNHRKIGIRLRFENLQFQSDDLKSFARPLLKEINEKFEKYGGKIQTQIKKNHLKTVSVLDLRITLDFSAMQETLGRKINKRERGLPDLPLES